MLFACISIHYLSAFVNNACSFNGKIFKRTFSTCWRLMFSLSFIYVGLSWYICFYPFLRYSIYFFFLFSFKGYSEKPTYNLRLFRNIIILHLKKTVTPVYKTTVPYHQVWNNNLVIKWYIETFYLTLLFPSIF